MCIRDSDGIIPKDKLEDDNFPYLQNGDVLLTDASEDYDGIGKALEIIDTDNKKIIGGLHTIGLRNKTNELAIGFGRLIFKNGQSSKSLKRIAQGTKVYSISYSYIAKLHVILPPSEEQVKIVEILNCWNEAIEKQEQLVEKLERRKLVIIQQLLSGSKRLPGYSSPFQVIKLGDIGEFRKGFGVLKDKIINSGQKAITYGEIYTKHNVIIKSFTSFIDKNTASQSQLIEKGDILFAGSGETLEDIGKCVAYIDDDDAFAGGDIIIYKPKSVNSIVLSYILNSPCAIKQKRQMGQGHSIVHIYAKNLSKIKVNLPSIEEQNSIAKVLMNIDKEIDNVKERLTSIRIQKTGLMQQLLTGKRRLNP
jgi:type I restriction enzyme S subunit